MVLVTTISVKPAFSARADVDRIKHVKTTTIVTVLNFLHINDRIFIYSLMIEGDPDSSFKPHQCSPKLSGQ